MNTLQVEKDSNLHILSCICSFIMFMTFLIYLERVDNSIGFATTVPVLGANAFIIFFNTISLLVPISMLIATLFFAKRKLEYLIYPIALTPVSYVLYEIYALIQGDGMFVFRQWFKVGGSILIFLLFLFTINLRKIKSRYPLIIACLVLIIASIVMTVCKIGPYVYKQSAYFYDSQFYEGHLVIYYSALIQFVNYIGSILFIALSLRPADYKRKESRKFTRLKNLDKIQAINTRRPQR